ncbi:MAG: hypothetical protein R3256_11265 [Thalassovita sp.]|nr:hypothetical protein [Thalassovita sp.]
MVDEIVIHLGDCKTGTTSIQSVLAAGAWESDAGDICYPARFNHIPLAKTLTMPGETDKQEKRFTKLRRRMDQSDAAHGVVSAEHFEFVDPELLHDALQRHLPGYMSRIRLIAYVRPHADRLLSSFAERNKKGRFMKSLPALHDVMLANGKLLYAPRFRKWRAVFGDSFTLRPFLRDQLYQGDVVQDFFRFVLGSRDFRITRDVDRNRSLSVEDIAMLRAFHRVFRAQDHALKDQQKAFGWFMSNDLSERPDPGATRPRLHRALAERVVEAYRADAMALDAEFFDGTPMQDALEAAPGKAAEQPQSFAPEDHFSAAEIRRYEALAAFLKHLIESDPRHFLWAVRPEEQRRAEPPRDSET